MRWTGYVARMGRRGKHIGFWCESYKERDHQEDLNVSINKMDLRGIKWGCMDWIILA
jgi:hypothetical protein